MNILMTKMNNKAFSLIELMVVIAIVALLAAVAVPAYKNYLLTAQLAPIISYAESVADVMSQHYDTNGAHATELIDYGYTEVGINAGVGVNAVAPNIPFLSQQSGTMSVSLTSCPVREFFVGFAGFDGDKQLPDIFGGSSTTYGHAGYFTYYVFTNSAGIHEKRCFYYMFEDGVISSADSRVGDCYNFYAAMTSPGSDAEAAFTDFGTAINAC